MKKYLMTAATALVLGGLMTSCTKDTDLSGGTARSSQDVQKTYEEAFLNTFGRPVEGLDWGFGIANNSTVANTRAMTRSNPGEDVPYTSDQVNANANQWGDPNETYGGWLVPPALTSGQKERVKAYFQQNTPLGYDDPHFRYFFVQQVYKGGDDPNYNFSTEVVIAVNNAEYNSNNMNLMTVGENEQHILNFNRGDGSMNNNVLRHNGQTEPDKISLMVNIDDTSCFGYHDSGSSLHHNDKAALVAAAVIDQWAESHGNIGSAVSTDGWNRSFLGFDLALHEGEQCYAKDNNGNFLYADYSQAPSTTIYAWDGENIIKIADQDASTSWKVVYKDGYQNIMKGRNAIGWLDTNSNFYVSDGSVKLNANLSFGEQEISSKSWDEIKDYVMFKDVKVQGAPNNKADVLNLKRIKELVDNDYIPINNKSLTEWVQVGKSDGYYSDWIVTLTEARKNGTTTDPTDPIIPDIPVDPDASEVMVVAEDLSTYISSDGKELADFDFNDVVFEVSKGNNGKVHIKLLAAGGTLPLTVGGAEGWTVDNHGEQVLAYEVHRLFKVSTGTMVNTNSTTNGATRDPVEFDIDYPEGVSPSNNIYEIANAIPIRVYREDLSSDTNEKKWIVIPKAQPVTSDSGSTITASKLCVDTDFRWCNERNHIDTKFHYIDSYGNNKGSRFRLYLNGKLRGKWWKDDTRISGDN